MRLVARESMAQKIDNEVSGMKQRMHLFSTVFLGLTFFAVNATAQTVSWKQIVGIALAGNVVGSGSGAVTGGFLPWTATTGAARVDLREGKVEFVFRGLVFAGGALESRSARSAR